MELAALVDLYALERLPSSKSLQNKHSIIRIFQRDTGISHTDRITKAVLLSWRDQILERASRTTWNTYLREMRALFNFAVAAGTLHSNPFLEVQSLRAGRKQKKTVKWDLLQQSLELLERPDEPLKPGWFWVIVLKTFCYTGIRRRQLVEMRWSHLDLRGAILHLKVEGSKTRREWDVPLVPHLVTSLEELHKRTLRIYGPHRDISNLQVFNASLFNPRYYGPEINEDQVTGFFRRLSDLLSREHGEKILITPHRLRHTMATRLASAGDLKSLQTMLGHTDVRMTMEYIEPDLKMMRSMLNVLPQL